jgi:hypothetical protein
MQGMLMQNLQQTMNHSDATLGKLVEVDSDLASQETKLLQQLEQIRDKRNSLQSVIGMFSSNPTSAAASSLPDLALPIEQPQTNTDAVPAATTTSSGKTSKSTSSSKGKQSAPKSAPKATKTRKLSKRGQDLQQYMRSEFEGNPLTQAVLAVLQKQADEVVGIPDMIDSIFIDETPKDMRSKASTRLATILSTGLKAKKWYRGKTGHYSISQSAARADLAS